MDLTVKRIEVLQMLLEVQLQQEKQEVLVSGELNLRSLDELQVLEVRDMQVLQEYVSTDTELQGKAIDMKLTYARLESPASSTSDINARLRQNTEDLAENTAKMQEHAQRMGRLCRLGAQGRCSTIIPCWKSVIELRALHLTHIVWLAKTTCPAGSCCEATQ
eukprot:SAG11_NODE_845_length_6885_cov_6.782346_5_plen_162_part_00